jgi:hypothetical protein
MPSEDQEPKLTSESKQAFWVVASSRLVVKRATRIAVVVGTILAAINHGDHLFYGGFDLNTALKIVLTYCVPYSVSTYSSVLAIRENSVTQKVAK